MDPVDAANAIYRGIIPDSLVSNRGMEFRIEADDGVTRPSITDWQSVQVQLPKGSLTSPPILEGSTPGAYRFISFPLNLNDPSVNASLLEILVPQSNKQWRLWGIDPQKASSLEPYLEYPNTALGNFAPGSALFLITRTTVNLTSGVGKTLPTLREYIIPLKPGWNMIGNPFNFGIPKSNIKPEILAESLVEYNGAFARLALGLKPWEGYLIKVPNADTLKIYPAQEPADLPNTASKQVSSPDWSINITASCQFVQDLYSFVGVAKDADMEWDRYERFEPPPISDFVIVAFPHHEWKKYPDLYATDFRPPSTEGHVWEFTVNTNFPGQPVTLRFENLETVPENFEVHLLDCSVQLLQNLREEAQYQFGSSRNDDTKKFRLLVGTQSFIEQHSTEALGIPATHQVSQNFPNPFNPTTTIRYGLPQAERVTLTIYNLLGEEVIKLVDHAEKKAGYHVAIWDGRNREGRLASSGVYIFRLRAENFVMAKKMALVK